MIEEARRKARLFSCATQVWPLPNRAIPARVGQPPEGLLMQRRLLVLGCSATKKSTPGVLPAVDRYDGPAYLVLRKFLRSFQWPEQVSVAVLSAKYGLIGGLTPIERYNRRMSSGRARQLVDDVAKTLDGWKSLHSHVDLILGRDYLPAIHETAERCWPRAVNVAPGPIGMKLSYLRQALEKEAGNPVQRLDHCPRAEGRPVYFLPDWDDFVDADFNFSHDRFSSPHRASRNEVHCSQLVAPKRLADGILVSLAQSQTGKGLLRAIESSSPASLAPKSVKKHFGLAADQWAFGDCGAFSYVNEDEPTISVEQAVAIYELFGFDLGASVDHIPVTHIVRDGKRKRLTKAQQLDRVKITRRNALKFMEAWRRRECRFNPVGVVQGLSPEDYALTANQYREMGYRRIALGGLVPKSDGEISEIVKTVTDALRHVKNRPWLHLMGVYRPKLQTAFRTYGVDSFDSATYFRKSWLRSDQNYLGADGQWYAAIRVPPSHDPRTMKRMREARHHESTILKRERAALRALRAYSRKQMSLTTCLDAVMAYDGLLQRDEAEEKSLRAAYRRTLEERPWEKCKCRVCQDIKIDVLIFRGLNRNKRRGAHNTLMLYRGLLRTPARPAS